MADYVKKEDFKSCNAVGILKPNLSKSECLDLIIKDIAEKEVCDKEFLDSLRSLDGVKVSVKYHPVYEYSIDYQYFTKSIDYNNQSTIYQNNTTHFETTYLHKEHCFGFCFKSPLYKSEDGAKTAYLSDKNMNSLKERLDWKYVAHNSIAMDVVSTDVSDISDFEYLDGRRYLLQPNSKTAEAIARDNLKVQGSALTVNDFAVVCFLEPYVCFEVAYKGETYRYFVNAYSKVLFDENRILKTINQYPRDKEKLSNLKSTYRNQNLIVYGLKAPLIVLPLISLIVMLARFIGKQGVVPIYVIFGVLAAISIAGFFALRFDCGDKELKSIGWIISHNKVKFIILIVLYIIAFILLLFVSAVTFQG